jgi:hypothetical protein
MTETKKPLSIAAANKATALALVDFAACLFMVRGTSPSSPLLALIVMVLAEVLLIALAVREWVLYFRLYVDRQIEERFSAANKS